MKPLRFHWSLSQVGDTFRRANPTAKMTGVLSLEAQIAFCRRAEACGVDSVLMAFGFTRPDPLVLSAALGMATEKIKFMIACRSGVSSPTVFVQQINTISALTNGRVHVNMVTGHSPAELRYYGDFLSHDERYERTDEFLTVCRALWRRDGDVSFEGKHYRIEEGRLNTPFVCAERSCPEIYLGGSSPLAEALAQKHADCLWRFPDAPERLRPRVEPLVGRGKEVGLLVSLLVRPTREQAHRDGAAMIQALGARAREAQEAFSRRLDSQGFSANYQLAEGPEWLSPCLWTGAIPYLGAPAIALVGSPEDVAGAILEYQALGVSQFLFMGWPDLDEMNYFAERTLPLVREHERAAGLRPS